MNLEKVPDIDCLYDCIGKKHFKKFLFKSVIDNRLNISSNTYKDKLLKLNVIKLFWFNKNFLSPFMHGYSHFDFAEDIIINEIEYRNLYNILGDDKSRAILLAVLKYKLSLNRSFLDSFAQHALDQYFDPLLISFGSDEVIADCGGFIGDTANSYFRMKNRAKLYYLIEPSEKNINIAKRSLKEFDNIHFCNCATGLRNDDVSFGSDGIGGIISAQGNNKVKQFSLDTLIKEPLTFIKMDIEGAEIESLKGAREQIKNNKPKLAICAYHKPDDAWQIVKTLTKLRPDYKFYFRLYFSPYCEAVIYAL